MPLDEDASRAAVGRLADSLGLGLEETAAGIINVNNLRAATLIRQQTLERGLDPRDFVLYAYGGAGPVHAFGYAAEIGVREVLIPLGNGASTLSAYGIAAGDLTWFAEVETCLRAPFGDAALAREIAGAVERARKLMLSAGVEEEPHLDAWALMRYQEQLMHSLEVPVDAGGLEGSPAGVQGLADRLAAGFTTEYARRYGASAASAFQAAEIFGLRVRARVPAAPGEVSGTAVPLSGEASWPARVFWPDAGEWLPTAVLDGGRLGDGSVLHGPALVELSHTTVAVPRGASLTADRGDLRLRLAAAEAAVKGAAA
jgi:N-methylhydantoinase A